MIENKMNGESKNILEFNISQLKSIFPEVFNENKIDFEKLSTILGDHIDIADEKYSFTWNGKMQSLRLSQIPSIATLRPIKNESIEWSKTSNCYIEGDNLEVLKLLQNSYLNKFKMIYIDPPYNTGNDFVYTDDFKDNLVNYKKITGQVDIDGNTTTTNKDTDGRYHTNWLNMMYPRLRLARNLLAEDGAIFISIDDNEVDNLTKICDEIFGHENFRNKLIVRRRVKSLNLQFAEDGLNSYNVGFEYILVYSKTNKFVFNPLRKKKNNISEKGSWNVFWSNADRPTMRYEILGFTPTTGQWRWQETLAKEAVENYRIYTEQFASQMTLEEYWAHNGKSLRFIRRIPDGTGKNGGVQYWVGPSDTELRTSNWSDLEVSQIAKEYDLPFENPKNVNLIKTLISSIPGKDFYVLDFFSGSATTADAVMRLNAEDNGNRKYILIQLPEIINKKTETNNCVYKTICDVGKTRIKLAGKRISEILLTTNSQLKLDEEPLQQPDTGFKVFKLDSSNIRKWNPDTKNIEQSLLDQINNFVDGRTEEDALYEIILKNGLPLTVPVEELDIRGKKVYSIGMGALIVCLDNNITLDIADEIANISTEFEDKSQVTVVFKDNGFANDSVKTNIKETIRGYGIGKFVTV